MLLITLRRAAVLLSLVCALTPTLWAQQLRDAGLRQLLTKLTVPDVQTRLDALALLGRLQDRSVADAITPLYKDADPRIRAAAVDAIGQLFVSNSAGPYLLDLVNDADPRVRAAAARAIGLINRSRDKEALLPLLEDVDPRVRGSTAEAYGSFHEQNSIAPITKLLTDKAPEARAGAVSGLGKVMQPEVIDALLAALKDKAPVVRIAAARALQSVAQLQNWVPGTGATPYNPGDSAAGKTVHWKEIVAGLIQLLKDKNRDVHAIASITLNDLYAHNNNPAIGPIIAGFKSKDPQLRREVAQALPETKNIDAVPALIAALRDKDASVREEVVTSIGTLHDARSYQPLLSALKDPDPLVRGHVSVMLRWLVERMPDKQREVVGLLLPALQDPWTIVQTDAIHTLASLGDERVVDPLIGLLKADDPLVVNNVMSALARFHISRAVPLILPFLYAKELNTRYAAIGALGGIGGEQALDSLLALRENSPIMRIEIIRALSNFPDQHARDLVLAALQDDDLQVCEAAIIAVYTTRDLRATELLVTLLQHRDIAVRQFAMSALVSLADPRAEATFIALLKSPDSSMRYAAIDGLAKLKSVQVIPALYACAKQATDTTTRDKVISVLQHLSPNASVTPELLAEMMKDDDERFHQVTLQQFRDSHMKPEIARAVIPLLRSTNPKVVNDTVALFSGYDNTANIQLLQPLLQDPSAEVRANALRSLRYTFCPPAMDLLLNALRDTDKQIQLMAIEMLQRYPEEQLLDALLPLLKNSDIAIRLAVLKSIGYMKPSRVADALLPLLNDDNMQLRRQALLILISRSDPRVDDAFIAALTGTDTTFASEVRQRLYHCDNPCVMQLLLNDLRKYLNEPELLSLFHDREYIFYSNYDNIFFFPSTALGLKQTIQVLIRIGSLTTNALLPLSKDKDPRMRAAALIIMQLMKDARAFTSMSEAMRDRSALVRRAAAHNLRFSGDVRGLPILLAALGDTDAAVRAEAALGLGIIQDRRAVPALLPLLADRHADVQYAAAWALGLLADPRSHDALWQCYRRSTDLGVRKLCLLAFGAIGDTRDGDKLLAILHNPDRKLHINAIKSLGELHETRAIDQLVDMIRYAGNDRSRIRDDVGVIKYIRTIVYPFDNGWGRDAFSESIEAKLDHIALEALVKIHDPHTQEQLLTLLQERRIHDIHSLHDICSYNSPQLVEAVINNLVGDKPEDARATISMLAYQPRQTVFLPMLKMLAAADDYTRQLALSYFLETSSVTIYADSNGIPIREPMPQSPRLVELLLAQANGADDDLRSKLVTILGTQRDPRVIKQLVTWLQDINPGLQRQVTTSLIALNEPGTVELLLPLLSDTRDAVCLNAALILSQIGISDNAMKTSVVNALSVHLRDADSRMRWRIVAGLCMLGDAQGLTPALELLQDRNLGADEYSGSVTPRQYLLAALRNQHDPSALAVLFHAVDIGTRFSAERRTAIKALLCNSDPGTTDGILQRLQSLKDSTSMNMPLLDEISSAAIEPSDQLTRDALLEKLRQPRLLDFFLTILPSLPCTTQETYYSRPDPQFFMSGLRSPIIELLGYSHSAAAVPVLIDLLEKGPIIERQVAATALGRLKDRRALPALMKVLDEFGSQPARDAVTMALQSISGEQLGNDPAS